ncbi:O-acetyl-ADP-ribose deacetylase [Dehalococcoidia bacterium]|nr:O-acetyl-ADP-ribose deacetylase [Dehalococcoidia bacterium]
MQINIGESSLSLVLGDITMSEVDAVVNAANPSLGGGGGVDGAIHRAGGRSVLAECKEIVRQNGPLPTGEAVITTGGLLKARFVIHTVGPIWQGGHRDEPRLLARAHRECLNVAIANGCTTVDFPAISTGIYGYPIVDAAKVAIKEVKDFLGNTHKKISVRFVLFDQRATDIFAKVLRDKIECEE